MEPIVQRVVEKVKATKAVEATSADMAELRALPIMQLVREMQAHLTGGDDSLVAALRVLVACITVPSPDGTQGPRPDLNTEALLALVKFLIGKATVFTTAEEASLGLGALCSTYDIDNTIAECLCDDLIPNLSVQAHVQKVRFALLTVFEVLVTKYCSLCLRDAPKFMRTLLVAVEGERDPVNVRLILRLMPRVAQTFPAQALSFVMDDFFETMSCYFPVMFNPPPNSPVSKEELKNALVEGLTIPIFHDMSLPFFLDKLQSSLLVTKFDSLQCIERILSTHQKELVEPHIADVAAVLRSEVLRLTAQERSQEQNTLLHRIMDTLSVLGTVIARFESAEAVLSLAEPIVGTAISTCNADSPSGKSYATMVHALCAGSPTICTHVGNYVVPLVLSIVMEPKSTARQAESSVSMIGAVWSAAERLCGEKKVTAASPLKIDPAFIESVRRALLEVLQSTRWTEYTRRVAMESAATMIGMGHHLQWITDEQRGLFYEILVKTALNAYNREEAATAAKAIANVGRVDGEGVAAHVFQKHLPAALSSGGDAEAMVLSTLLPQLGASSQAIAAESLRFLLCHRWTLAESGAAALEAATKVVTSADVSSATAKQCVEELMKESTVDIKRLRLFGACLACVEDDEQLQIVGQVPKAYEVECDANGTALWAATMASVSPRVLAQQPLPQVVGRLMTLAASPDSSTQTLCMGALCRVVNHASGVAPESLQGVSPPSAGCGTMQEVPCYAAFIRGAYSCGNYGPGDAWLKGVVAAVVADVSPTDVAALARCAASAAAIAAVLAPATASLHPLRSVVPTWEQRFYHVVKVPLLEKYKAAGCNEAQQGHIFGAMAQVIEKLRPQALTADADDILELVSIPFYSTGENRVEEYPYALKAIKAVVDSGADGVIRNIVKQNANGIFLLDAIATTCLAQKGMQTKALALDILTAVAVACDDEAPGSQKLKEEALKFKTRVLVNSKASLDDSKRVVRKAAAACRHHWFLL